MARNEGLSNDFNRDLLWPMERYEMKGGDKR